MLRIDVGGKGRNYPGKFGSIIDKNYFDFIDDLTFKVWVILIL